MNTLINIILAPIRKSPISFLAYGLILFLPELFLLMSWERGTYIAANVFTTIAFSYMVSWILCGVSMCFGRYDWIWHVFMHTLLVIMAFADIVISKLFRIRLGFTAFQLVIQTNGGEAEEFFEAYLTNSYVLMLLAMFLSIIILELVCCFYLRKYVILLLVQ